jgi:hypothetical protein
MNDTPTNSADGTDDKLVHDTGKAQVADLIDEFKRCTPVYSGWHRIGANESIRFCRWPGQAVDGKKHDANMQEGTKAFPFEGASDSRTFLIDDVIEEIVGVELLTFYRAILRVQSASADDTEGAAYINQLLNWIVGTKQFKTLRQEVELHSQYTYTYGWSVLQVSWLQEHVLKLIETSLEQIMQMAQQAQGQGQGAPAAQIMAALPAMIMDKEREQEFVATMMAIVPGLTKKRAKQMARDLRETGQAKVPMPTLVKNEPLIRALKPWEEVFIANTVTDIQHGRVFVKEWLNETQVKQMQFTDKWDPEWIEEVCKLKGQFTTFGGASVITGGTGSASDASRNVQDGGDYVQYTTNTELIEIIHGYTPRLDEDNVRGIWRTTFHALLPLSKTHPTEELCAKHELLDYRHGQMPFIVRKRENWSRSITSSRGLPEIFHTTERSFKSQEDGIVDSTSLSVMPPILVPELAGVDYTFGPGAQIPVAVPGREPKVMAIETPGVPHAFELMDRLARRIGRRIGTKAANESPEGPDAQRQKMVSGNLGSWSEAFEQEFQLIEQFMEPDEFERITGAPQAPPSDQDSISKQYDFILTFDVRELSMDHVMEELKAIRDTVLPVDTIGRIDRGKLVELMLRAIDPSLAKELLMDNESASQQVFAKVKLDLLSMMGGFQPELVEMDATAQSQLEFAKQLMSTNPKMQQALQQDPQFKEQLQIWEKNRMQSVLQERNKMIGRVGVDPNQGPPPGAQPQATMPGPGPGPGGGGAYGPGQ